mmetsp:Transcript_78251/g.135754  ORF Transcript_78251/g.135754 Transcript_78251/m.135754 type:complete len:231 (-) Transcript_78251:289-981(-)
MQLGKIQALVAESAGILQGDVCKTLESRLGVSGHSVCSRATTSSATSTSRASATSGTSTAFSATNTSRAHTASSTRANSSTSGLRQTSRPSHCDWKRGFHCDCPRRFPRRLQPVYAKRGQTTEETGHSSVTNLQPTKAAAAVGHTKPGYECQAEGREGASAQASARPATAALKAQTRTAASTARNAVTTHLRMLQGQQLLPAISVGGQKQRPRALRTAAGSCRAQWRHGC